MRANNICFNVRLMKIMPTFLSGLLIPFDANRETISVCIKRKCKL